MSIFRVSLVGILLAVSFRAAAHHSPIVLYQLDKEVTYEGVVTNFRLGNPHVRVYFTMADANGDQLEWMAEGGSRTVLLRNGWSEDQVRAGDIVRITGNPSKDGSRIIHLTKLVLPDGTELWGEDTPDESFLESLRRQRR